MLSTESIINLQALVSHQINQLDAYSPASMIFKLEARFTLMRLQKILSKSSTQSVTNSLKFFLKARWHWIENTDIAYTHDFLNPANCAAIALAKALADEKVPYLIFIIPTLGHGHKKITYITSALEENPSL